MGYIVHDAIIVTSWDMDRLSRALSAARSAGLTATPICEHPVNGGGSFLVVPDGSKEGWSENGKGDANRAAFMDWLDAQAYEDGSNALDFVAVRYGGDWRYDNSAKVERENASAGKE